MQQLPPIRPDLHYWRPESLAGALQAWTLTTSPDEMRDMSSVEYQKTNSTTFGKLSGKGLYQDDYWLRAVTTWNFLQLNLCWNYIFLASSEYIDLEMNFKSERVYIFTIRWYFALWWARLSLVLKTILSLSQGCPNEKFHLFCKFFQTQSPIKWTWQR